MRRSIPLQEREFGSLFCVQMIHDAWWQNNTVVVLVITEGQMSKLKMSIFGLDFEYRNIRKSKIYPSVLQKDHYL